MRILVCTFLVLAAVGCAPVTVAVTAPEEAGVAPVGEGAADILQMRARALRAEVALLWKEHASLEKRRAALEREANDYRSRAVKAKRSPYLSASQRKAKFGLWTDIAMERDRQVNACGKRLTSMMADIMILKMKHETALREGRQAGDAVVPAPG